MKRYKDMNDKELADMVKKTKSNRTTMRLRLGESADLSAYDKQIRRRDQRDRTEARWTR